jgi:kynurenine formamidase
VPIDPRLPRTVRVIDLEQPRHAGMPIHDSHRPGYFYALHRRHRDTYRPEANGPRSGASGVVTMMEHSGTHIDALCHQACGLQMHGGVAASETESPAGFRQLGVETVPPLFTRAVLIDAARSFGIDRLPDHYSLSADELIQAAQFQNVMVEPGDVLLVRTGSGAIWDQPETYLRAAGIGKSGSQWAASLGVVAVGADNMAWDPLNGERDPDTGATLYGHVHLLVEKGIYIMENLFLEVLAAERIYEFAFAAIPLKLMGATGSPIRPLALV